MLQGTPLWCGCQVLTYPCTYGGSFKEPVYDAQGQRRAAPWEPDGLAWARGGYVEGLAGEAFAGRLLDTLERHIRAEFPEVSPFPPKSA